MDLRVFHGCPLRDLQFLPFRVFFNAVNLEEGRQAVIGPRLESGLRPTDVRRQWRGSPEDYDHAIVEWTTLSRAVAGSTAFPPWFGPVPIPITKGDDGAFTLHFVDGGVTDNAGFKLARGLAQNSAKAAKYPAPPGGRDTSLHELALLAAEYVPRTPDRATTFRELVGLVLTLDASRPPAHRRRVLSRTRAALRLAKVAQNAQADDLEAAKKTLQELGVAAHVVGLQAGFVEPSLALLTDGVTSVRTQLDPFTSAEIAALAYCGYAWIEYMLAGDYFKPLEPDPAPSALSLDSFLEALGLPQLTVDEIAERLRTSSSLWSVRRMAQRLRDAAAR